MRKRRHKSKRRQKGINLRNPVAPVRGANPDSAIVNRTLEHEYEVALDLGERGDLVQARSAYGVLSKNSLPTRVHALVENDMGSLDFLAGDVDSARARFETAIAIDRACVPARQNLELLDAETRRPTPSSVSIPSHVNATESTAPSRPIRIAIVSVLFNWPSTGGGTVHTAESGKFLRRAGFDVCHFYAQFADWEVGNVTIPLEVATKSLSFDAASWNVADIQQRFRSAVDRFAPDYIIITDSWNLKPVLADAFRGYRYYLRLAAQECLCPLNNVRLLMDDEGRATACPRHQLATADICRQCVAARAQFFGSLHQAERSLSGYGTPEYDALLRRAFAEAEGILVVNPLIAAAVSPYAKAVHVVPSGFDPDRFPWPYPSNGNSEQTDSRTTILFAGLVSEYMKGFHIAHEACAKLWGVRQDFELLATADPAGRVDDFTRYVGWQSQDDLPRQLRAADVVVFPTVAEEALGRSAVEAMGVGRPVIASRIGGLPYTVTDGTTGLLFEPGNAADLAAMITILLDDASLRQRMGEAGRKRFEDEFAWPVLIDRKYRQILRPPERVMRRQPGYAPSIPQRVDLHKLCIEISEFFGLGRADVDRMLNTYRAFHDEKRYATRFGEFKTLNFEEAFILCVLCSLVQPRTVVELGTGTGRSTRRIVDLVQFLGLGSRVISYDVSHDVQHVSADEVELICDDVMGRFRTDVLEKYGSGIVFLDVHLYALLHEAVTETLAFSGDWSLVIHDCGRGFCNPNMTLAKDDPAITSDTGIWERHVLAEAFSIADPLSEQLDTAATATHRLRIFSTLHGMGVIVPGQHAIGNQLHGGEETDCTPK